MIRQPGERRDVGTGELRLTALGVGHGDALLVRWDDLATDTHWSCLVDGGKSPGMLLRKLESADVKKIDLLVLRNANKKMNLVEFGHVV
jgi:beta-lactamase superfamily II metal-dependent hydrolase